MEKLAIGTVQLGEVYGRHTEEGLPTQEQAVAVLLEASKRGVPSLDTASNYGCAEARVGLAMQAAGSGGVSWEVVTKVDEVISSGRRSDVGSVAELEAAVDASIEQSLQRLGGGPLDVCCIHNVDMWLALDQTAWRRLIQHRDELGTVRRIGASAATIDEVLLLLADADVQHVQMPLNLLDWRHHHPAFQAAIARRSDVTIHARSAFLQGVLLNDADRWPEWAVNEGWAARVLPPLDALVQQLGRRSRADLCLAFARGIPWVTQVLVGVRTVEQVVQNAELFMQTLPLTAVEIELVESRMLAVLKDEAGAPAGGEPSSAERLVSPWMWSEAGWARSQQAAAARL